MELTINIKENSKMAFILELLSSFDYIDIIDTSEDEESILEEHKRLIDERLKRIKDGTTTFRNWDDIKKKYEKAI